jgi:hypothetical protein
LKNKNDTAGSLIYQGLGGLYQARNLNGGIIQSQRIITKLLLLSGRRHLKYNMAWRDIQEEALRETKQKPLMM